MEQSDFKTMVLPVGSSSSSPSPGFMLCVLREYANIIMVFKLTPCTCIILWFQFQWLYTCPTFTVTCSYQTRSVEHVTAKVGQDQSHLGKQEILECIVSE